ISGGPALGVIGYECDGLTVTGSRLHDNNTGAGNPGNEAGGLKLGACNGVTISGNEVDHNSGPGIWADVSSSDWTIRGNRVHDNTYAGIMFEIGARATITANSVWENGWGDTRGWGWAAGILVSSSGNVSVTGNTVAWSPVGISFVSQDRGVSTAGDVGTANWIVGSAGHMPIGYFCDWSDPSSASTAGNSLATSAQLIAAGIPTAPEPGH
ncbi:MAG TPA: right-handed parallel beta-helix repeat-containing protein, partial [Candidatus Sulfotelmatobacter sp.]|nr:right-handed parallel beta-helix repeat-containing protein [Candidatus Sulfotelmatobacter sp.]